MKKNISIFSATLDSFRQNKIRAEERKRLLETRKIKKEQQTQTRFKKQAKDFVRSASANLLKLLGEKDFAAYLESVLKKWGHAHRADFSCFGFSSKSVKWKGVENKQDEVWSGKLKDYEVYVGILVLHREDSEPRPDYHGEIRIGGPCDETRQVLALVFRIKNFYGLESDNIKDFRLLVLQEDHQINLSSYDYSEENSIKKDPKLLLALGQLSSPQSALRFFFKRFPIADKH